MMDMLREMIHDLRARVEVLEAKLAPQKPPEIVQPGDNGGAGGTIQPDDPTNEDDNE